MAQHKSLGQSYMPGSVPHLPCRSDHCRCPGEPLGCHPTGLQNNPGCSPEQSWNHGPDKIINQLTISQWHNARIKRQEREVLQQNIEPFTAPLVASELLPPVLQKLPELVQHGHASFDYDICQDASGQATQRSQGQPPPVGSMATAVARPSTQVLTGAAHFPISTTPASAAPPLPVAAAPEAAMPMPVPAPGEKRLPKTTVWRRKKLAEAAAAAQGLTPGKRQIPQQFLCQKYGQPKT
ncbi:hypothetical protein QQF64_031684 [Cirrhinus molitorella]|uniref:Uncharacterized protein n=1 Tax=Cirrhinus molitorella TaxID=172907 RepID=A0ABR3MXT7_9TELE